MCSAMTPSAVQSLPLHFQAILRTKMKIMSQHPVGTICNHEWHALPIKMSSRMLMHPVASSPDGFWQYTSITAVVGHAKYRNPQQRCPHYHSMALSWRPITFSSRMPPPCRAELLHIQSDPGRGTTCNRQRGHVVESEKCTAMGCWRAFRNRTTADSSFGLVE